ncbi:porin family protein [Vibrio sp. T187]|uniref:porin family protein n=1 Tax=Vibrio TaxID=662 RepID=UPI0010CA0F43|nr:MULTISPECIES: porin family protein [Vibrio]MBW3697907.1 porin family protein [Vibrio sp. T187]
MKLFTSIATVIAVTAATNVLAQPHFQGHRVGVGVSTGYQEHYLSSYPSSDIGSGLKLEYGYDINRIVGFNLSFDKNTDEIKSNNNKYESNLSTLKVDADIGYTFKFQELSLKPYGAIGLAHIKDKWTVSSSGGSSSISATDTSILSGVGLRANFNFGLYTDLRFNFMMIDDYDLNQTSLTVGYKF